MRLTDEDRAQADELAEVYRDGGYDWLEVSAHTGEGMEDLKPNWPKGFTSCPAILAWARAP